MPNSRAGVDQILEARALDVVAAWCAHAGRTLLLCPFIGQLALQLSRSFAVLAVHARQLGSQPRHPRLQLVSVAKAAHTRQRLC